MKEIGIGLIVFFLGVSTTLFFLTAGRPSWSSQAESPAPALRSTIAEDVPEDPKPLIVITDSAACVRCCVPVRSVDQGICTIGCIYDAETEVFRYLRPSDVLKE